MFIFKSTYLFIVSICYSTHELKNLYILFIKYIKFNNNNCIILNDKLFFLILQLHFNVITNAKTSSAVPRSFPMRKNIHAAPRGGSAF